MTDKLWRYYDTDTGFWWLSTEANNPPEHIDTPAPRA